MSYFDGIRKDDRVWDVRYGWGTVRNVDKDIYSIEVLFDCKQIQTYLNDGRPFENYQHPTLFWSDPGIVAPPRPRRMKKVKVEVRPYLNKNENKIWLWGDLNRENNPHGKWIGPVQFVEIKVSDD